MKPANRIIPVERRQIAHREVIEFTCPIPPSANALFLNVAGKGRIKTRAYRDWIKEAGWAVQAARLGHIDGPVVIHVLLSKTMRGDGDNRMKAVLDLVVRHGLIKDDNIAIVKSVRFDVGKVEGARVTIRRAAA